MNPRLAAKLMRSSIEQATPPARYRSQRMARRDRQALVRVLILAVIAAGVIATRVALS